ncbi:MULTISPECIES: ATP-binding protein [unclassified Embleya]|uniref:ATP-binding protein n=1 Tax=unclassified Embleya TaxID=2699296 RepID=UPI0033CA8F30
MAIVELRFSALPEHVRTARLVAAAVARRAGVAETVLDEVRLAVGEACSRAVGMHQDRVDDDRPVTVTLDDGNGRFSIEVNDGVPQPTLTEEGLAEGAGLVPDLSANGSGLDLIENEMGLAVILGLVDDLDVRAGAEGGVIRMSWPSGAKSAETVG